MKYLHTMIRISNPEETLRFFELLGLREIRRMDDEAGRFTLIFLAAAGLMVVNVVSQITRSKGAT